MNTKDYVTYQTAKLLKAAGYPQDKEYCAHYDYNGDLMPAKCYCTRLEDAVVATHLWDAMKWLREEKKLFLEIQIAIGGYYDAVIFSLNKEDFLGSTHIGTFYDTYESVCDAGITAACEWLIAHVTNADSK